MRVKGGFAGSQYHRQSFAINPRGGQGGLEPALTLLSCGPAGLFPGFPVSELLRQKEFS